VTAFVAGLGGLASNVVALSAPSFVAGLQAATLTFPLFTSPSLSVCEALPEPQAIPQAPARNGRKPLRTRSGADVKAQFLKAISPAALAEAIKLGVERGWKPTDTFTVIEPDVRPGLRRASAQDGIVDLGGDGQALIWDWDTQNAELGGGTLIVETWNPYSTSTTFQAEYWTGDVNGYTTWARFLEGRDRDGHLTREVSLQGSGFVPPSFGMMKARFRQTCARQRADWRGCMRDCMRERLNVGLWTAIGAGSGSARICGQFAGRAGIGGGIYVGLGAFVGCVVGSAGIAGGSALIYQFGVRESCDSAQYCGPAPSCQ
jgi:hypothetical protein